MKRLRFLLVSFLAGISIFSCSKSSKEVITLSYSIFFPATHEQCIAATNWAKEIEKRTDGKVKINIYPGGTLTKADETYNGVISGIADIGMSCFAYTRGRFPVMEAVDLPLGYPSGQAATFSANEFYKMMKPKELDDVKVLYIHAHGPGLLHTQKLVKTLADLKGKKIRSTGLSAKVVTALGGIPIAMPQGSTYESLQKGVVDGTFAPMETLKGWKQGEVVKHTVNNKKIGYTTGMYVIINKKKWEAMSEDIQKKFIDVSNEWVKVHAETWDKVDVDGEKYTRGLGNSVEELLPAENDIWVNAVKSVIDEYIDDANKKGLSGNKSINELKKLIVKYSK